MHTPRNLQGAAKVQHWANVGCCQSFHEDVASVATAFLPQLGLKALAFTVSPQRIFQRFPVGCKTFCPYVCYFLSVKYVK